MSKDDRPVPGGTHLKSDPSVTEGGKAPSPTKGGQGHAKPSASLARGQGKPTDGTSSATAGEAEMEHAAVMGAQKPVAKQD